MPGGATPREICTNCGATLNGRYCSECGQARFTPHDLQIGHLTHDFVHEATHVDSSIWRTMKALLFRPGLLTAEYWAGRHAAWVRPLRIYLVVTALHLLLAVNATGPLGLRLWTERKADGSILIRMGARPQGSMPAAVSLAIPQQEPIARRVQTFYKVVQYASLALFAAGSWMLYRRRQPYYGAHLIFGLHYYSFLYLATGVVQSVGLPPGIGLLVGAVYLGLALRRLYGEGVRSGAWKTPALLAVVIASETAVVFAALQYVLRTTFG